MTKAQFHDSFPKVLKTRSYTTGTPGTGGRRMFHIPNDKLPDRVLRYLV